MFERTEELLLAVLVVLSLIALINTAGLIGILYYLKKWH